MKANNGNNIENNEKRGAQHQSSIAISNCSGSA
jgi:hypothetical protein